jgi:TRAP-type transport system periplasmic protein
MLALARRGFLHRTTATSAGMATLAILTRASDAAEFFWRHANRLSLPIRSTCNWPRPWIIRKESRGRTEIQIFPSNQLGSDTAMLSRSRCGAIAEFNLLA